MEVYNNNPKGVCNYPFDTATGEGGNAIVFLKASLLNRGIPQGDTLQAEPAFTGGIGK